jgi:hypothetical protein
MAPCATFAVQTRTVGWIMPSTTAPSVSLWKRLIVAVCVLAAVVPVIVWAPLPWPLFWIAIVMVVVWLVDRLLGLPKGWFWPNWRDQARPK